MRTQNAPYISVILIFVLFLANSVFGKSDEVQVRSNQMSSKLLHMTVYYGDRTSEFVIVSDRKFDSLFYRSNQNNERQKRLTPEDTSYILSRLKRIAQKNETRSGCARKSVFVKAKMPDGVDYEASACIDDKSPTSKGLMQVANLFAALF